MIINNLQGGFVDVDGTFIKYAYEKEQQAMNQVKIWFPNDDVRFFDTTNLNLNVVINRQRVGLIKLVCDRYILFISTKLVVQN